MASQRYLDPSINNFKKTNMYYVDDPMILYQDPIYLGFKLLFYFDQPDSGLLSTVAEKNTAIAYLERIGETVRAEYLRKFVNLLKAINQRTPWFFQTLSGLTDAWKHGYEEAAFVPMLKDRKLEIGCLDESVDLRITALMDLYRKACFDWPNRREIVPRNLRFFKVSVYCYEGRIINRTGMAKPNSDTPAHNDPYPSEINRTQVQHTKNLLGKDPDPTGGETSDYINANISRVMFNFSKCEFLPDESGVIFEGMTNADMQRKPQKIVFKYGNVWEDNVYNTISPDKRVSDAVAWLFDSLALDNPNVLPSAANSDNPPGYGIQSLDNPTPGVLDPKSTKAQLSDSLGEFGNKFKAQGSAFLEAQKQNLKNLPAKAQERAISLVNSKLNSLLLGNVYSFSLTSDVYAGLGGLGPGASITNNTGAAQGNVGFGESASISNTPNKPSGNYTQGSPSLSNDNGPDSSSQNTGNSSASLSNK